MCIVTKTGLGLLNSTFDVDVGSCFCSCHQIMLETLSINNSILLAQQNNISKQNKWIISFYGRDNKFFVWWIKFHLPTYHFMVGMIGFTNIGLLCVKILRCYKIYLLLCSPEMLGCVRLASCVARPSCLPPVPIICTMYNGHVHSFLLRIYIK